MPGGPFAVAGGDDDVARAGGQQVDEVVGVVAAVEDHQPAAVRGSAPQRFEDGPDLLAVTARAPGQPEGGGQVGEAFAQGGPVLGGDPPHHVVLGGEAVRVLGGHLGLADAGEAEQGDGGRVEAGASVRASRRVPMTSLRPVKRGLRRGTRPQISGGSLGKRGPRRPVSVPIRSVGSSSRRSTRYSASYASRPQRSVFSSTATALGSGASVRQTAANRSGWRSVTARRAVFHSSSAWVPHGEVTLAEDEEDPAAGAGEVVEGLGDAGAVLRVPALEGDAVAVFLQAVADPHGPGAVEPGEADDEALRLGVRVRVRGDALVLPTTGGHAPSPWAPGSGRD